MSDPRRAGLIIAGLVWAVVFSACRSETVQVVVTATPEPSATATTAPPTPEPSATPTVAPTTVPTSVPTVRVSAAPSQAPATPLPTPTVLGITTLLSQGQVIAAAQTKYGACMDAAAFREQRGSFYGFGAQAVANGRWLVQSFQLATTETAYGITIGRWFEAVFDETTGVWLVVSAPRGC